MDFRKASYHDMGLFLCLEHDKHDSIFRMCFCPSTGTQQNRCFYSRPPPGHPVNQYPISPQKMRFLPPFCPQLDDELNSGIGERGPEVTRIRNWACISDRRYLQVVLPLSFFLTLSLVMVSRLELDVSCYNALPQDNLEHM